MTSPKPAENNSAPSPSVLRVALYSLLFNLVLVAAKLFLSAVSGSLALRADAVHSLVDVLASAALILGLKISERKSESFPLGLYKVENLASIAISFLLFATAYGRRLWPLHRLPHIRDMLCWRWQPSSRSLIYSAAFKSGWDARRDLRAS